MDSLVEPEGNAAARVGNGSYPLYGADGFRQGKSRLRGVSRSRTALPTDKTINAEEKSSFTFEDALAFVGGDLVLA
jgi:hypothetical protein